MARGRHADPGVAGAKRNRAKPAPYSDTLFPKQKRAAHPDVALSPIPIELVFAGGETAVVKFGLQGVPDAQIGAALSGWKFAETFEDGFGTIIIPAFLQQRVQTYHLISSMVIARTTDGYRPGRVKSSHPDSVTASISPEVIGGLSEGFELGAATNAEMHEITVCFGGGAEVLMACNGSNARQWLQRHTRVRDLAVGDQVQVPGGGVAAVTNP
ncbi:hypothetical protein T484DRAFT_1917975 [Baffinella frigidus]|nr:hypothetical protein T484DRAFT_1917975 [Cryptophyta sp. CCMP2293]